MIVANTKSFTSVHFKTTQALTGQKEELIVISVDLLCTVSGKDPLVSERCLPEIQLSSAAFILRPITVVIDGASSLWRVALDNGVVIFKSFQLVLPQSLGVVLSLCQHNDTQFGHGACVCRCV